MEALRSTAASNPVLVSLLDKLVRGFATDIPAMGRALRLVFEQDQEGFYAAILPVIRKSDESRGYRYLAALFVSNGLITRVLSDGALSLSEAVSMAKLAMQIDPMLDVALMRQATESAEAGVESVERILAVLSGLSDGVRIMPSLSLLLRHSNPRVRSKAALMLGRGTRNPRWVERVLNEEDPRVRANAVESIWGVNGTGVREVLIAATADDNNRVAGNALLALYRLGESWTCRSLCDLASHARVGHRATAAWIMGEIEDPRFTAILARLMADGDATVRRRAHLSIKRIRAANARTQPADGARLFIGMPQAIGSEWKANLAISGGSEWARTVLKPTQFSLFEEDQPVFDYQVETLTPAESLAVALLIPVVPASSAAIWLPGVHDCLEKKRNPDIWAVMRYREAKMDTGGDDLEAPRYSTSIRTLAESLIVTEADIVPEFVRRGANPPPAKAPSESVAGFWSAVRGGCNFGAAPSRGSRHMILLNLQERDEPADFEVLVNSIKAQRIRVHAISAVAAPVLEALTRNSGGMFYGPVDEGDASECLKATYSLLLSRYCLRYTREFLDRPLRVRIQGATGVVEGVSFLASQPRNEIPKVGS